MKSACSLRYNNMSDDRMTCHVRTRSLLLFLPGRVLDLPDSQGSSSPGSTSVPTGATVAVVGLDEAVSTPCSLDRTLPPLLILITNAVTASMTSKTKKNIHFRLPVLPWYPFASCRTTAASETRTAVCSMLYSTESRRVPWSMMSVERSLKSSARLEMELASSVREWVRAATSWESEES